MISIYTLCDPTTGEVRYLGLSRNPTARLRQYRARTGGHTKHLKHWLESINRDPMQIVLEQVPIESADQREREWIALLRSYGTPLINYTDGGEGHFTLPAAHGERSRKTQQRLLAAGTHNFFRSDVRARMLAKLRADHRPRPWAAAQARRLSISQRGVPLTEEHKQKCSLALRGKVRSPEAREKDRESGRRRWADPAYRAKMAVALKRK